MAEAGALLGVLTLLVLGAGLVALRAVLDGRGQGASASIAVLAPAAEGARLLRSRPWHERAGTRALIAGAALLLSSVVRVLALPMVGPALLGPPLGVGWFVVADVVWWAAGAVLADGGRGALRRFLLRAAAVEVPLLIALAAPIVAARSLAVADVRAAQRDLPLAAEAPVAFVLALVVAGVLLPWVIGDRAAGTGPDRLLVAAGLAGQPVAAAAVAGVLFLGGGGSGTGAAWLLGETAVLAALLVVVTRRFPVLRPHLVARLSVLVLLPLAIVQLAVVVALALLAG
jgi:NADH-quinone oxidoreductase subunit H